MPMIGEIAPKFHAMTTTGEIDFPKDFYGKWVILFSYVSDFSPVCTTEMMTLAAMVNEFREIDTELIGLSGDSLYSHIAWTRKIRELSWKDMKRIDITFPLIADSTKEIATTYGMLCSSGNDHQLARSVYLIDEQGRLRAEMHYPTIIGRNMKEIKRMVVALQKADEEHALIPAEWIPEEDIIIPVPDTCSLATDRIEKVNEDIYCLDWFLSFKQSNFTSENSEKIPEMNPYPTAFPARRRPGFRR